ncbi:MAG: alkylated DNA repair dioxygenase AlkB [Cryomorphaceae bacterium]|jgi:alkylated DNA repair dioxygenase AlkB
MNRFQTQIFGIQEQAIKLPDAEIEYWASFVEQELAFEWYRHLLDHTHWQQDTITVYGKQHLTPRLSSWVGESWMSYRYSNHTMQPSPWSAILLNIKNDIESRTGHTFNSVLVNYYRDGRDSNGWHSDDEPELGAMPIIASLSLGANRDFQLRHKTNKNLKHTIVLENGSLLVMQGSSQSHWQHQIPKRAHAQGRINLTFRTIHKPPQLP